MPGRSKERHLRKTGRKESLSGARSSAPKLTCDTGELLESGEEKTFTYSLL